MKRFSVLFAAFAVLLSAALPLRAGGSRVALVPWDVLDAGESVDAPLVVYWVPASADELRRSDLLTSYDLTLFSARCVAMRVVRFNDRARLTALAVDENVPVVILTDGRGRELGRVASRNGAALPVSEVEELVRRELARRTAEAEARLDRAREHAAAREHEAAIALYEAVWESRCLCPRQAKDAKRALRKMGRR